MEKNFGQERSEKSASVSGHFFCGGGVADFPSSSILQAAEQSPSVERCAYFSCSLQMEAWVYVHGDFGLFGSVGNLLWVGAQQSAVLRFISLCISGGSPTPPPHPHQASPPCSAHQHTSAVEIKIMPPKVIFAS